MSNKQFQKPQQQQMLPPDLLEHKIQMDICFGLFNLASEVEMHNAKEEKRNFNIKNLPPVSDVIQYARESSREYVSKSKLVTP